MQRCHATDILCPKRTKREGSIKCIKMLSDGYVALWCYNYKYKYKWDWVDGMGWMDV